MIKVTRKQTANIEGLKLSPSQYLVGFQKFADTVFILDHQRVIHHFFMAVSETETSTMSNEELKNNKNFKKMRRCDSLLEAFEYATKLIKKGR